MLNHKHQGAATKYELLVGWLEFNVPLLSMSNPVAYRKPDTRSLHQTMAAG